MEAKRKCLELYFHIPFCVRKCNYCDFLSSPADREVQEAYMAALFSETEGRAGEYKEYEVVSVFIGGGTPSVVEAKWIVRLMTIVREKYCLAEDAEITIEVNPGTVNREMLSAYRQAGINRLSIGLQSANKDELKRMGRIHSFEEFVETYYAARAAGFQNINVDVMSALPGQSLESYRETLHTVLTLNPQPEHISAYSLIVEEGTLFAKWEEEGSLDVPDEDTERFMYEETKRILESAGFERYEISNYAKAGYECCHNIGYWKRVNYVGFGIGAASLVGNKRFSNDDNLQKYMEQPLDCRSAMLALTVKEQMEEFLFLGLRMTKGVNEKEFAECFGCTLEEVYGQVITRNMEAGLLCYRTMNMPGKMQNIVFAEQNRADEMQVKSYESTERYLALTEKGLDVSNYVMAQFIFDEE